MKPYRVKWWLLVAYGIALVAAGMVFKLADSVRESDAVAHADARIADDFVNHRTPFVSSVARVITLLGSGWVVAPLVVVTAGALLYAGRRRGALIVAMSSSGAGVLVAITKHAVGRSRPPVAGRLVTAHGLAFPSGHAAQSVACFGALAWLAWELDRSQRIKLAAVVGALLIGLAVGLSRVYLGVHWPSDVLSGWLLGVGWLAALIGASAHPRRQHDSTVAFG